MNVEVLMSFVPAPTIAVSDKKRSYIATTNGPTMGSWSRTRARSFPHFCHHTEFFTNANRLVDNLAKITTWRLHNTFTRVLFSTAAVVTPRGGSLVDRPARWGPPCSNRTSAKVAPDNTCLMLPGRGFYGLYRMYLRNVCLPQLRTISNRVAFQFYAFSPLRFVSRSIEGAPDFASREESNFRPIGATTRTTSAQR